MQGNGSPWASQKPGPAQVACFPGFDGEHLDGSRVCLSVCPRWELGGGAEGPIAASESSWFASGFFFESDRNLLASEPGERVRNLFDLLF